jgi:hypothetical protein
MAEFVSTRYMKKLSTAINHVKYISFRERSSGERYGLFTEDKENIEVKDFIKTLDDKRTSHKDVAKIHTVLFSMSGNEYERGNFQEEDYKTIVRNIMKDWQLEKGITVEWAAAEHNEKGHPHVHVVIKSVYKDSNGVERRLKFTPEDRQRFKEMFKEEKARIRELRGGREPLPRNREQDKERNKKPALARDVVNNLILQIKQRLRQEELKRQFERDRDINR